MTQHYLVGELSVILGELQAITTDEAAVRDVVRLRREAELTPPAALRPVVVRAVKLIGGLCWAALARGETEVFLREALIRAQLCEFGVCAGLLEEGQASNKLGRS